MQNTKNPLLTTAADFNSASGPVTIRMNNDYLFRALLQRNNHNWTERSLSYLCRSFDNAV